MKTPTLLAATVLGIAVLGHSAPPAQAKVFCLYAATDTAGRVVTGTASHKKGSVACKRARRECNRIVNWKRKRGRWGRSHGCRRSQEVD